MNFDLVPSEAELAQTYLRGMATLVGLAVKESGSGGHTCWVTYHELRVALEELIPRADGSPARL